MKKLMLLFILLLLPIGVFAKTCDTNKVKINSIEMTDKSDGVTENEEASFEGLNANLDLKFSTLKDHIEYKIIVENKNTNDFELTKKDIKTEYFDYKYIYDDNTPIVKANSKKQINLRIDYYNPVSQELINNGFVEEKQIVLNLSNEQKITNPKTSRATIIGLILVLLGLSTMIFVTKNKKEPALLLLLVLLLPVGVFALCNVSITTNSRIEIGKEIKEFCFIDMTKEARDEEYYKYEDGMTWEDFRLSDYNNGQDQGYAYYFDPKLIGREYLVKYNRIPNMFTKSNCTDICINPINSTGAISDKSLGCYWIAREE